MSQNKWILVDESYEYDRSDIMPGMVTNGMTPELLGVVRTWVMPLGQRMLVRTDHVSRVPGGTKVVSTALAVAERDEALLAPRI